MTLKTYSFSNFPIYNTVLLTIVTMLYIPIRYLFFNWMFWLPSPIDKGKNTVLNEIKYLWLTFPFQMVFCAQLAQSVEHETQSLKGRGILCMKIQTLLIYQVLIKCSLTYRYLKFDIQLKAYGYIWYLFFSFDLFHSVQQSLGIHISTSGTVSFPFMAE